MKTTEVKSFADVDTSELKQPIICVFNKPDDYPDKYVAGYLKGQRLQILSLQGTQ